MKKLLVLSMLSAFSISSAAYACDGMKDHKAGDQASKGDSPSAKKESKSKKDPSNKS
jgi:hypothetical protein